MNCEVSLKIAQESETMGNLDNAVSLKPATQRIMPEAESHNLDPSRCKPTARERAQGAQGEWA